jgi:polyisoprenoid-binding protein YceI
MKFNQLAAFLALTLSANAFAAESVGHFVLDTKTSVVKWEAQKVVTGGHNGLISVKEGFLHFEGGALKGGEVSIDMASLTCEDLKSDKETAAKLVGHLTSPDFFDVKTYPTSKFVVTSVKALPQAKKLGAPNYEITGDLTLKKATHPITFPALVEVKGKEVSATAKINIDRTKWDVRYGSGTFFKGLGDKAIKDEFTLDIALRGKAQ